MLVKSLISNKEEDNVKRFIKLIVSIFLAVLLVSCGSSNKAEYGNNIQTENIGQGSTTDNSKNNVVYETNRKIVYIRL